MEKEKGSLHIKFKKVQKFVHIRNWIKSKINVDYTDYNSPERNMQQSSFQVI